MKKNSTLTSVLLIIGITLTNLNSIKAYDITVAKDGSGNYNKVQDAFNAVPNNSSSTTTIYIKNGTYKEKLKLVSSKKNVKIIGESRDNTILTYDDHASIAGGTDSSYSTLIEADDFYAENVTFQNTIDSRSGGSQAVALMVKGDRVIFYNCRITGFQDTYYLKSNTRSYTKNCIIEGTTDFIFGAGIALFEDCIIKNRKNSHVTAHSQKLKNGQPANKYGFVFKNCEIIVHPQESVSSVSLGRPWGNAARVVYLNCYEGSHIKSDGWSVWSGRDNHLTAYYAEYKCNGPGYQPGKRLSWTHQLSDSEAAIYTKEKIFKANTTTAVSLSGDWNPVIGNSTNNPPSVSITSPTNNQIFIAPSNITINAKASDSEGSVSKVEFFQGSTLLGTDTSSPFSFTWNNVSTGSYSLTAKATDEDGLSSTSSVVTVIVNVEGATSIIIQENETGFGSYDGLINNDNSGFTGDGFVNTDNASGKGVNWEICVPEEGAYTLVWRYANASSDNRRAQVEVNGSVKATNVSFPSTGSWSVWSNSGVTTVTLSAGTNQIRLEATSSSGLANVDYVSIAGNDPQAGSCSNDIPVAGVSVLPTTTTVNVGATTQLISTVSPSNASNKNVSWSSENSSIASVSSSGMVTGVAEGSTTITVTTEDGNFTATCHISVTNSSTTTYSLTTAVVGQGSVSPSSGIFSENELVTLTATPSSNWKFVNWSGDASGTSAIVTITMDSDQTITANFEADETGGDCDNPVTISTPFSKDGVGEFCWQTTDDISYVNSWNLETLEINGTNFTNTWSDEMPPKQDGYYNIHYESEYSWAHLEIASTKSAKNLKDSKDKVSDFAIHCYPNPVGDQLNIQFSREINEMVDVYLFDATGKMVKTVKVSGFGHTLDISALPGGLYLMRLSGANQHVEERIVKQ